ncbi:hypothetical protein V6N13_032731 [Hibiscus sabdariffa]|uniref:Transmembrane protein n=1 Tax=Hibiscus sabdariffa TaxID=183260 RepID=A0ABR2FC85_9ROSI
MANSDKMISKKSKYGTVALVTAPFIVIGGLCIGFGWKYVSGAWNERVDRRRSLPRSMSLAAIHAGKLALGRLVGYQNFRAEQPTRDVDDIDQLQTLLQNEQPNFKEIQGDLQRALKCKCLAEGVSDARPSLYKAIISLMDNKEEVAVEHWKNFKETQNQTSSPSFNEDDEFTEFKNAVNLLKQDIDSATQL